ncbi:DJ-1/PfpI family protein [Williamsia sp. CHRR-6]|uniref:DJ-1/PfpI family protein n=1 Tax=Williamsia sp. CHRR-6 TaxID=2835871 RepID=UPI001BDA9378|nr:DJ-1/PfpI family protein [Williamsia sp. CHRR-6]MBT0568173.1 DJ-1/PfpI family protein [Williamsia sp. CHRR-6]
MTRQPIQIAIVVYPGMTVLDIAGPYEVLRFIPRSEVRFVWTEPGPVVADSGVLIMAATHSFDETPTPDIVLIGGSGTASASITKNTELIDWLTRVHQQATWTAGVCTGSIVLAHAGLLAGQSATTHWSQLAVLDSLGVRAVDDQRIVQAGRVVTGAGVSAGIDLALWLVGKVAGDPVARAAQLLIEYDPQPPYDSGSLAKADATTRRAAAAIVSREAAQLALKEPADLLRESAALSGTVWRIAISRARRRFSGRRRIP